MINKIKKLWPDWEIADNLGGGSFGQVYEIHRDVFGQIDKAAVKVLSIPKNKGEIQELRYNGYDDASITAHYKNHLADIVKEYNLMAQLKGCANVVYCEDVRYVQAEDGIGWDIYIKMELLKPLAANLSMPIDEQQVIKIGMDICNALVLCKEKSIIHRDIKPQNLFVSDDGTYKLGDFGIAKTIERTMGGTRTGTYNYMAPEVYNNQPQGTALDQYSLGMVLYWILNNRRVPFMPAPPAIPTATQEEQARVNRMSGNIPVPAPANGSEALKNVVLKAIAHNPKDRFASPEAMRDALRALMQYGGQQKTEPMMEQKNDAGDEVTWAESWDSGDNLSFGSKLGFEDSLNFQDSLGYADQNDAWNMTESITQMEGTMGNAWTFEEGSVGPGTVADTLFQDANIDGTVGINNKEKTSSAPKQAAPSLSKQERPVTSSTAVEPNYNEKEMDIISYSSSSDWAIGIDRAGLAKPIKLPDYRPNARFEDREDHVLDFYFAFDFPEAFIDRTNVDDAITLCKLKVEKGDFMDQGKKMLSYCNAVKSGKLDYFGYQLGHIMNELRNQEKLGWSRLYWGLINHALEIDPYHEEAYAFLEKAYESEQKATLSKNPLFCARRELKADFTNGKAYTDIAACYVEENQYDSYKKSIWYFERGLSLFKEKNAFYAHALGQYAVALAECVDVNKAEHTLNEAEAYGYKDAAKVRKRINKIKKGQTKSSKGGLFGKIFG